MPHYRDYIELCKPRVVALMVLTSVVGMCLATPHFVPWKIFIFGNLGIALMAGSAAAINHFADYHIDLMMTRTKNRPIPSGKIAPKQVILFAIMLSFFGISLLVYFVNWLTALLTFFSLVAYAGIYTYYLKHATSQNIVIGGVAGAAPPLLGWVAVTNHIDPPALLLMLIIFVWTPPHFWALAIARVKEYAAAKVPMLPITHGIPYTKLNIILYTLLLCIVTILPFAIFSSGYIYLTITLLLNGRFLYWAFKLKHTQDPAIAMQTFRYSIIYLMCLFIALLIDHYYYGVATHYLTR